MATPIIKQSALIATSNNAPTFVTQTGTCKFIDELAKNDKKLQANLLANTHKLQNVSHTTLLLNKREELRDLDLELEKAKLDYRSRINDCERRRIALEEKQTQMKEQVQKVKTNTVYKCTSFYSHVLYINSLKSL